MGDRSPVHDVLRAARASGGEIKQARTSFDQDRQGRVLTLKVFWPGISGYLDAQENTTAQPADDPPTNGSNPGTGS